MKYEMHKYVIRTQQSKLHMSFVLLFITSDFICFDLDRVAINVMKINWSALQISWQQFNVWQQITAKNYFCNFSGISTNL